MATLITVLRFAAGLVVIAVFALAAWQNRAWLQGAAGNSPAVDDVSEFSGEGPTTVKNPKPPEPLATELPSQRAPGPSNHEQQLSNEEGISKAQWQLADGDADPDFADHLSEARNAWWSGEMESAESSYRTLVKRYPANLEVVREMGDLSRALGHSEQAADLSRRALLIRQFAEQKRRLQMVAMHAGGLTEELQKVQQHEVEIRAQLVELRQKLGAD